VVVVVTPSPDEVARVADVHEPVLVPALVTELPVAPVFARVIAASWIALDARPTVRSSTAEPVRCSKQ
jgi:hypothetical protein